MKTEGYINGLKNDCDNLKSFIQVKKENASIRWPNVQHEDYTQKIPNLEGEVPDVVARLSKDANKREKKNDIDF